MRITVGAALVGVVGWMGCAEPQPSGPFVNSSVETFTIPVPHRARLDLLFVIDRSPEMASHRDRLVAAYPAFISTLAGLHFGLPDLRIGVVTADPSDAGALRTTARIDGAFLVDGSQDGVHVQNYTGELSSAFTELADVGFDGATAHQPLAMTSLALAAPSGFVRDDAWLAVIVIAGSDDASAAMIEPTATALKALKAGTADLLVGAMRPAVAPRLDDFLAQFPNRATTTAITTDMPTDVLERLVLTQRTTLGLPCLTLTPLDLDEVAPGLQVDCAVSEIERPGTATEVERVLPSCDANAGGGACWSVVEDAVCAVGGGYRIDIARNAAGYPYDETIVRGACQMEP